MCTVAGLCEAACRSVQAVGGDPDPDPDQPSDPHPQTFIDITSM